MTGTKREIERSLYEQLGFPVIVERDPEQPGTVRVYSMATENEHEALSEALRGTLPADIVWIPNNPDALLRDFIDTSRDALKLVKLGRKWRSRAYLLLVLFFISDAWALYRAVTP
jgi:hypothetical protein